jgi:hypothetical protein
MTARMKGGLRTFLDEPGYGDRSGNNEEEDQLILRRGQDVGAWSSTILRKSWGEDRAAIDSPITGRPVRVVAQQRSGKTEPSDDCRTDEPRFGLLGTTCGSLLVSVK